MLRIGFEKGNKNMYYHIIVDYNLNGEVIMDDIVIVTKAPKNAVLSALTASTKYMVTVIPAEKNVWSHSEIFDLDYACNWLSRIRFYNIQKKIVEKVIQVAETETVEL